MTLRQGNKGIHFLLHLLSKVILFIYYDAQPWICESWFFTMYFSLQLRINRSYITKMKTVLSLSKKVHWLNLEKPFIVHFTDESMFSEDDISMFFTEPLNVQMGIFQWPGKQRNYIFTSFQLIYRISHFKHFVSVDIFEAWLLAGPARVNSA